MNYKFDIVLKYNGLLLLCQGGMKAGDRCHVEVSEGLQGQKEINWDKTTCSRKNQPPEQGEHTMTILLIRFITMLSIIHHISGEDYHLRLICETVLNPALKPLCAMLGPPQTPPGPPTNKGKGRSAQIGGKLEPISVCRTDCPLLQRIMPWRTTPKVKSN